MSTVVSPKITCSSVGAHIGDRDVTLECQVRAKPIVTALFWIVDVNGTTQADGDVNDNRIVVTKVTGTCMATGRLFR